MIAVTALNAADAPALEALQALLPTADQWSMRSVHTHLGHPQRLTFGVWQDQQLVAFLLAGWVCDEAELYQIATAPAVRQQGLAKVLFAELIQCLQQRGVTRLMLEVRESNHPAQQLYSRLGFEQDGIRKGYYPVEQGTAEDALLFSYKISE